MKSLLFFLVAVTIAGSNAQETALGTDYLRAHANHSLPSNAAINAQAADDPPPIVIADDPPPIVLPVDLASPITTTDSSKTSTGSTTNSNALDVQNDIPQSPAAKITIDLGDVMKLVDEKFNTLQTNILAALQGQKEPAVPVLKSYRTHQR